MPFDREIDDVLRDLDLDEAGIARRKAYLGFTERDIARLADFHRLIEQTGECTFFVDAFYRHLLSFPETAAFLEDPTTLARLKKAQEEYFHSLTAGDYGPAYIRNRVRVGMAHERIGLAPEWYLGAYSKYLSLLIPKSWELLGRDPERVIETLQAVIKVIVLDVGLAIDTYIHAVQQAIHTKAGQLEALNRVAVILTSTADIKEGLQHITALGRELTGAAVALVRHGGGVPREWYLAGISQALAQDIAFATGGLADEAFATGYGVLSRAGTDDRHVLPAAAQRAGIGSCLCLPLISHTRRLGVLTLFREDRDGFTAEEIELLTTCASLAAGAIETAQLHGELVDRAVTDALTGLPNRRYFDERLDEELGRVRRYGKPFTLLMLDLDHFKTINDAHGHAVGDAVLRKLAEVLLSQLREVDFAARYGGEEFTLILPETDTDGGRLVAERICETITATPFPLPDGTALAVTASVGVVTCPYGGLSAEELLEHGDAALYAAKLAGRNRVVAYSDMTGAR